MHVTPYVWAITIAVTVVFLLVDVFVIGRRPHEPSVARVCPIPGVLRRLRCRCSAWASSSIAAGRTPGSSTPAG